MKRRREEGAGARNAGKDDPAEDPLAGRPGPKLFIGSLAKSVQEKDVLNLFLPYGKVVDIAFFWHMHGPRKGEPKGFCFVTYARTEEATSAIRALDRRRLHGRSIAVRYQRDADDMNMDARTLLSKARAKSLQQSGGGGRGGRATEGEGDRPGNAPPEAQLCNFERGERWGRESKRWGRGG
ncbi:polyadenylate-binding protein [Nannochloropsis gaditana]|uniref:Polyadenylate-binding protein n=1 Tax=Nannochloropsis gaditana TaxID=72520 RepID=W7TJX2_9STRA|nr:polyadenylate-binding protein [Nannochloropsis gaditana]